MSDHPGIEPSRAGSTDRLTVVRERNGGYHSVAAAQAKLHADQKKLRRQEEEERPWYRRPLPVALVFLAVLALVIGATLWWRHSRRYESTDDAAIDVVPQLVSAELPGRVVRVAVHENQDVAAGAVLVELEGDEFRAKAAQARAELARAAAQIDQAKAQRGIYDAQRDQAGAGLTVAEANADNAAREFARLRSLREENAGAVSQQQWDAADAAQRSSSAQVEAARKSVAAAGAQVGYAATLLEAAEAAQRAATAQLQAAELDLAHLTVRARVAGRVTNVRVNNGNYVQPGAPFMAVVPREVYVTANFKETQLAHMHQGQPVEVRVDAYPDLRLTGQVESLQPGTGQTFSSLPPENATGNWVKVVQRVAVRVALDSLPPDDRRLGPGLSVTVRVIVR